jgi:hypothetical protein
MPRPGAGKDIRGSIHTSLRLPTNVPPEIIVEPVLEPHTVFRVTFATSRHDRAALLHSLTSNRELRRKPRKIERIYGILHFAISTWTAEEAARANARTWPQNGDHIVRLELAPGLGFCVDRPPDGIKHRTLWAPTDQILQCVADFKGV